MSDSIAPTDIRHTWDILRSGASDTSGIEISTLPTEVSTANGPVRLALGRKGEARILLPLSEDQSGKDLRGAPALRIEVSRYTYRGRSQRFLDLTCMSAELETVFRELTKEILSRITAGTGCDDAARSTIEEFRALLSRASSSQIQISQVAGLIGELLFLDRVLDQNPAAWKTWQGPCGDRHDFAAHQNSLEVKTSLKKGRTKISVNGLEQLEPPTGGRLYLLHFELEAVSSGQLSISSLGKSALRKADDIEGLEKRLAAVGCSDVSAEEWNQTGFRLEAETLYEVTTGFPRLIPSMFANSSTPAGISNVAYTTDLAFAFDFKVEPAEVAKIEGLFCQ